MNNVGDKVRYRVNKGRGRPAVGEIVARAGVNLKIRNLRNDQVVFVNPKMITADYAFKPYNTKARRGEVA